MRKRPAETTTATVAIVAAVVTLFGLDLSADQMAALVVIVGFVPSVATWVVERRRRGTS